MENHEVVLVSYQTSFFSYFEDLTTYVFFMVWIYRQFHGL